MRARHLVISGLLMLFTLALVISRPATPGYTMEQAGPATPPGPNHLTHPCPGMDPAPPFSGLSPLSITWANGMCDAGNVYGSGYGDITVWQANGHDYVALSGFAKRAFHIFNVDDPYHPVLLISQVFPSGGTASTSIFAFKQGTTRYLSIGMRGSGTGCGFFVYNVDDPATPVYVNRKSGADWCTVHEYFVSTDANGNADYAWLAMSAESGSGYKVVSLNLQSLPAMTEGGRYQRPDANGSIFVHDTTVVGNRVFIADWNGGVQIFDKATLATTVQPAPLNPVDSIRPAGFNVHHMWPTTDGNHLFIEDEFQNNFSLEKVKVYNISNIAAPYYETGIIGNGVAATNRAHNLKILNQSPGHDLLFVGWYQAGTRGFSVDTSGSGTPVITEVLSHQLRQSTNGEFGDVWGVDYLPCTLQGQPNICVYSSDMAFGLVADALGNNPALDPYAPESAITDPVNNQTITTCSYNIMGTAHDYWSGLANVEVSLDNGATWQAATGTTTWNYAWTIPADGAYTLKVRGTDQAGNVQVPTTSITVNVAGSCAAGTSTPVPPTATPVPPSNTPVPPPSNTPVPPALTDTPVPPLPSNTPVPPAATSTPGVSVTPCAIVFTDVHPTDYFYTPVQALACQGVISGYGDETFRPYNNTTR
ncbi:MAG TPA: Ig-like domain-containing protein, partial [Chloroflexia bacterium]|nr:Ig-like domain-containing protein [Chloroflexia bacterium]